MDNIRHYQKWKNYQKQYVKKNRSKIVNYAREYYHKNKSRFKTYYEKYKNQKINGVSDVLIKKDKFTRVLERSKRNDEKLLEKARAFREELRSSGFNPEYLGTF